ncbi:hypothetical protein CFOL_v3_34345, partial [Cephalotus follicularis]
PGQFKKCFDTFEVILPNSTLCLGNPTTTKQALLICLSTEVFLLQIGILVREEYHGLTTMFYLCLFYHKRILEDEGHCPGCRKPYEHEPVEVEASAHGGSLTISVGSFL